MNAAHRTQEKLTRDLRAYLVRLLNENGGEMAQRAIYQQAWDDRIVNRRLSREKANLQVHERLTSLIQDGILERVRRPQAIIKLTEPPE